MADEESGTNVEQVAANTAAILQAHPDLTGMVGMDSEAGPGIVRAVDEAGKAGQLIVTSNEAGREFMNAIKDGKALMINMEKYETMDFFAVVYLYTFQNDMLRIVGGDPWHLNPLPDPGDSGPHRGHQGQLRSDHCRHRSRIGQGAADGRERPVGRPEPGGPGVRLDQPASSLPMFVARVYPGLDAVAHGAQRARRASPDRPRSTCRRSSRPWRPSAPRSRPGVIVVGGWDTLWLRRVDKCVDMGVPTAVTDGDLPMSKRLTYLGNRLVRVRRPARPLHVQDARRSRPDRGQGRDHHHPRGRNFVQADPPRSTRRPSRRSALASRSSPMSRVPTAPSR